MPSIVLQLAYLVIFVWSVFHLVQDLRLSRKDWLNMLLYLAVALVALNWLLDSLGWKL
ncbi:hypothetical protein M3223_23235 [Paenibacillus pasadenensis]|uniref:hypothetical protein n=1 Tax=Paenibacillus pasadenensis TaxID=217090 RepID=UPI002040EE6D|nr:hypothetical protein [Paenibacillus pasadenensis]MCM3750254.1 hypothetical protein [Paenibacillus pasadenensis]